jgi:uncharacterized protein (TIGR02145 family)
MKKASILIIFLFSGTSYMNLQAQTEGSFTDSRDGKTYKTVTIGDQVWMAENLAFKADSGCWAYKGNEANVEKFGYLYNWETAQTVAPEGWRLPTHSDFLNLYENYKKKKVYKELLPGGKSNFNALFSGFRIGSGSFVEEGSMAVFWSDKPVAKKYAYSLIFMKKDERVTPSGANEQVVGASVRLIKD